MILKSYQTAFHREGEVKVRPITLPDSHEGAEDDKLLGQAF